jgi:hypothetical protein
MSKYSEQYDNIEVPEGLDEVIGRTIRKNAGSHRLRIGLRTAAIIVLAMVCLASPPFIFPGALNFYVKIPVVGSLFATLRDYDQMNKAYLSGFTTMYDEQQTVDGITVHIKDVYVDKTKFVIGTVMSGELTVGMPLNFELYYNDEMIITGQGSGSITYALEGGFHSETMSFLIKQGLPDKYTIKLLVNRIVDHRQQPFMEFNIPVDLTEVNRATRDISIMQTVQVGNDTIILKNIVFTPYDTTIQYEFTNTINFSEQIPGTNIFAGSNTYTAQLIYGNSPLLVRINQYRRLNIKDNPNFTTTDGINYYQINTGPRIETRYGTAVFEAIDIHRLPYLKINILDQDGKTVLGFHLEENSLY